MGLKDREREFNKVCANFLCIRPASLIAIHSIDKKLYDNLRFAAAIYLSRCIDNHSLLYNEALVSTLTSHRKTIANCTPNGAFMPKRHLTLEFNALYKAYADVMLSLKLTSCIANNGLLNIRYKDGVESDENLGRNYATEEKHSESWISGSPDGINIFIPLFGDIERNKLDYFMPPDHFQESWLKPLPNYRAGIHIAEQYYEVKASVPMGSLGLFDYATLHQTSRSPGAQARVSIDDSMFYRTFTENQSSPYISRLTLNNLADIGNKKLLVFPESEKHEPGKPWKLVSI